MVGTPRGHLVPATDLALVVLRIVSWWPRRVSRGPRRGRGCRLTTAFALLALGILGVRAHPVRAQTAEVQVQGAVSGAPPPPSPPVLVVASPPPAPPVHAEVRGGAILTVPRPPPARVELVPADDVSLRFAVEALFGYTNMAPPVDGSTFGLGLELEVAPLDWLALGVRGGWSVRTDVGSDQDGDGRDDVEEGNYDLLTLTGGPRFRIPTSRQNQDAFVLELGGGYAYVVDGRRPAGAVLEVAFSRWGDAGGAGGGPVVRFQQGLGDAGSLTTLLVGLKGGFDTQSSGGIWGRSDFRYTFGVDLSLGGGFFEQGRVSHGFAMLLGMALGVPIADVLEPRLRLDYGHRVAGQDRDGLDTYAVGGSLRLLLDLWAPLYFEAGGGWAFRFGTRAPDVPGGAFLDLGAGARFADCDRGRVAVTVGLRSRIGLAQSDALTAIYGVLGVEYDSLAPADPPRCREALPEPAPAEPISTPQSVPGPPEPPPIVATLSTPPPPAQPPELEVQPSPTPPPAPPPPPPSPTAPPSPPQPAGPTRIPLRVGLEPLVGLADSNLAMEGPFGGAAATFGVAFDQHFGLDLRLAAIGGPDALLQDPVRRDHVDAIAAFSPVLYSIGAGPRWMAWTDEARRLGWLFELVGSYAYLEGTPERGWNPAMMRPPRLGLHGGLLELGLGPQIGIRCDGGLAFDFGLTLRLQQGLGDLLEYRAILLGLRLGIEADTPEPGPPSERPADFQYTFGANLGFGLTPGGDEARGILPLQGVGRAAVHFGLPLGRWFEVRARGGVGLRGVKGDHSIGILEVGGGARLRFDEVFPLFVEASAGYAFQYGESAARAPAGAIVEVGIGARFTDCTGHSDGAVELGVAARFGVEDTRTNDAIMATIGYEYAGGQPMFGRNERWHCRQGVMRQYSDEERRELEAQQREAERLERERGERERREVEWQATVPDEISAGAGATVTVTIPGPPAPPTVVVPPAPPAPQTFELMVGVALGPGFEVRLLPEMLPLAALVGAGYVAVELIGPPQVLARAEAELRAVFGAQGLRLDAVTHVSAWDPTVRARITVYPPGAR